MLSPELAERSSQKNRIIPDGMRMMTARPERQKYDQIRMTKLEGIIEWQMIPIMSSSFEIGVQILR